MEHPRIPRPPALPGLVVPQGTDAAESAHADEPMSAVRAPGVLDDAWEEVSDAAVAPGSDLQGGDNPATGARARFEEQTRAEPASSRSSALSSAPQVRRQLLPSATEVHAPREAEPARSLDHVDGPLSIRAPIASIGRYTLFERFAIGGMATVHFGRLDGAGGFSRVVALKRLLPHLLQNSEFVEMLLKEARLAGRVRHSNVVQTLDVVAARGEVLIVLEYVHGESLSALCRIHADRQELIPIDIAVAVLLDALRGLHAVHEATDERGRPLGLVHRDVSPANVIVGVDGLARVLDFGIVKALELMEETIPNRLKGKTGYMSPEQTRGERVTRRSDVFSAGIVLWELLTLRRFAAAKTDKERMDKILSGKYDPPSTHRPEISIDLDAVVMKALAYDPEDRFSTTREFADALQSVTTPATGATVADWVNRLAESSLAERGRSVAQVENWDGSAPTQDGIAFANTATKGAQPSSDAKGAKQQPLPVASPQDAPFRVYQPESGLRLFGVPMLLVVGCGLVLIYWLVRCG